MKFTKLLPLGHLTEDQLIRYLLDPEDFPQSVSDHMEICEICRRRLCNLERDLFKLETFADRFAPAPPKKYVPIIRDYKRRFWIRVPMLATALTVLVLFLAFPIMENETDLRNAAQIMSDMNIDQQFMTEMIRLEEEALPEVFLQISEGSTGYYGEDFLDFIIPVETAENSV